MVQNNTDSYISVAVSNVYHQINDVEQLYSRLKFTSKKPQFVELYHPTNSTDKVWDVVLKKRTGELGNMLFQAAVVYAISKKKQGRVVLLKPYKDLLGWFPNLPFHLINFKKWHQTTYREPKQTYQSYTNKFIKKWIRPI